MTLIPFSAANMDCALPLVFKPGMGHMSYCSGLEIATNTVAFATKISGEVANLRLVVTFILSKQKG